MRYVLLINIDKTAPRQRLKWKRSFTATRALPGRAAGG